MAILSRLLFTAWDEKISQPQPLSLSTHTPCKKINRSITRRNGRSAIGELLAVLSAHTQRRKDVVLEPFPNSTSRIERRQRPTPTQDDGRRRSNLSTTSCRRSRSTRRGRSAGRAP